MSVFDKAKEVNDKLDAAADEGISDAVGATGKFTFWALVGAAVVFVVAVGLLAVF